MADTGIISTYEDGVNLIVQWAIGDFFHLEDWDGTCFQSPDFSFGGQKWCLGIYPNGWRGYHSSGYVDLWLRSDIFGIRHSFTFALKTAEGDLYNTEHHTRDFDYIGINKFYRFIPRAELKEKKSELVPNGVLTVVCIMERWTSALSDGNDPENACLRECIQSVRASIKTVEVATQTVEEKCEAHACPHDDELHYDLKQLFLKEEDYDIIIKVKDSEFPAHRVILKARSPVFASTFRHDMRENATGIVEIEDCEPSTFSDFLCYLYCGDATLISQENVFGLFTTSDKYQVLNLRAKCLDFMKQNLSVDSFCETLTLAVRHSEAELIRLCTDYFKMNIPKIIVTVKWQTFLAENPTECNKLLVKSFVPNCN